MGREERDQLGASHCLGTDRFTWEICVSQRGTRMDNARERVASEIERTERERAEGAERSLRGLRMEVMGEMREDDKKGSAARVRLDVSEASVISPRVFGDTKQHDGSLLHDERGGRCITEL